MNPMSPSPTWISTLASLKDDTIGSVMLSGVPQPASPAETAKAAM